MISEYVVVVSTHHAKLLYGQRRNRKLYEKLVKRFTETNQPVVVIHSERTFRIASIKNARHLSTNVILPSTFSAEPAKLRKMFFVKLGPRLLFKNPGQKKPAAFDTYAEAMTLALREGGEVIERTVPPPGQFRRAA